MFKLFCLIHLGLVFGLIVCRSQNLGGEDEETTSELNETQKRKYIQRYYRKCLRIKGVQNAIVYNSLGIPKHSTFSRSETIRTIGLFDELLLKVKRAIQIISPGDQLVSIRLRTQKFEIFIATDLNDMYFVIFQSADGGSSC